MTNNNDERLEKFKKLFPGIPEDQVEEASHRLDRYLLLASAIYESVKQDPIRYAEMKKLIEERKTENHEKSIAPLEAGRLQQ